MALRDETSLTGLPTDDDRLWPAEAAAARAAEEIARRGPGAARGVPFGLLVRMTRVRARLSQAAAGELLAVAPGTVSRWERGEFEPPRMQDLPLTQEQVLAVLSMQIRPSVSRPVIEPSQAQNPGFWHRKLSDTTPAAAGA